MTQSDTPKKSKASHTTPNCSHRSCGRPAIQLADNADKRVPCYGKGLRTSCIFLPFSCLRKVHFGTCPASQNKNVLHSLRSLQHSISMYQLQTLIQKWCGVLNCVHSTIITLVVSICFVLWPSISRIFRITEINAKQVAWGLIWQLAICASSCWRVALASGFALWFLWKRSLQIMSCWVLEGFLADLRL